jgi:hypothetical protein
VAGVLAVAVDCMVVGAVVMFAVARDAVGRMVVGGSVGHSFHVDRIPVAMHAYPAGAVVGGVIPGSGHVRSLPLRRSDGRWG